MDGDETVRESPSTTAWVALGLSLVGLVLGSSALVIGARGHGFGVTGPVHEDRLRSQVVGEPNLAGTGVPTTHGTLLLPPGAAEERLRVIEARIVALEVGGQRDERKAESSAGAWGEAIRRQPRLGEGPLLGTRTALAFYLDRHLRCREDSPARAAAAMQLSLRANSESVSEWLAAWAASDSRGSLIGPVVEILAPAAPDLVIRGIGQLITEETRESVRSDAISLLLRLCFGVPGLPEAEIRARHRADFSAALAAFGGGRTPEERQALDTVRGLLGG